MKSLKWCTIAVAVALLIVWGSQAQDWNIQSVASGPDSSRNRVLEPDIAVDADGVVYISYIDQAANAIKLLQMKGDERATTGLVRDTGRVAGTSVAVSSTLVCVAWEELSDESGVQEVWQVCWEKPIADDAAPTVEPWRLSTEEVIAGQADGAGWGEFGLNFDNAFAPDGTLYAVWTEDYAALKVGKYKDGALSACGDLPPLPITDAPNRYPMVYVDNDGGVWVGVGDVSYPPGPNIWVWYSGDQCATWTQPVDVTPTGLYSDGVGLVRLGDKLYVTYDEDQGADPGTANIEVSVCDATPDGPANCVRKVAHKKGGFPNIATDGKGLYVVSTNEGELKFSYSCDAGETWTPANIPNGFNLGFRDPDFGAALSRPRVATNAGSPNVYVVWLWRTEGKSNIMLGTLPKPCQ